MLILILIIFSFDYVIPEDSIMQKPKIHLQMLKQQQNRQSSFPVNFSDYYPFNVTINHLSPRSIEITWSCKDTINDRYEVIIKPVLASFKIVETVPNNICYVVVNKLEPDTAYQVAVTSVSGRSRKRSGYVLFKTFMEDDYTEFAEEGEGDQHLYIGGIGDPALEDAKEGVPRVRFVEISLVVMALVLWAAAIILFFNRWGKIRMLLPYQPDYKEMKNSNATCTTCSITPHHQCQKIHHLQNPTTSECYQAQGMTTTYQHTPHHHHHHHLPHQPMSEPGPSSVFDDHHHNINLVTLADTGCSPIRYKIPYFNEEGDISIEMPPEQQHHLSYIQRKARSAEQLKHYASSWEEPNEFECTEF